MRIDAGAQRTALAPLLIAAGVVLVSDLASKQWALQHLAGRDLWISGGLHLTIVHNDGLAWGMHAGGFGLEITAVLTIALIALIAQVCGPLMAIDAVAPIALGLLVGAGAANLLDAVTAPAGVVDFIAYTRPSGASTVFNVADVFAAAGFALLVRTVFCLVRAIDVNGADALLTPLPSTRRSGQRRRIPVPIVSIGHGFAAMCAFVWLYSLAIVWAPDAGRSAPSTILCAVAVFAASFVASQAWSWVGLRRQERDEVRRRAHPRPPLEIVVDRQPVRDGVPPATPARPRRPAHDSDVEREVGLE